MAMVEPFISHRVDGRVRNELTADAMIRAGENEREIFLTCAKWVPEQDRLCQVIAGSARNDAAREVGTQAGFPVLLKVRKPQPVVVK